MGLSHMIKLAGSPAHIVRRITVHKISLSGHPSSRGEMGNKYGGQRRVLSNNFSCLFCFYLIISFVTGSPTQDNLEVLVFPEQPVKEPSLELQVPCIFCDREFPNTTGKNDAVLHHLLVEHQLVIGEVAQVCDMRRYVLNHCH